MEKHIFKIRDIRKREKLVLDDAYIDDWAALCGPDATLVYVSLCRHVNVNQECFPSQELIAKQHRITTRRVRRGIKQLLAYNVIQVARERDEKGRLRNFVYVLLDRSEWARNPCVKKPPMEIQAKIANNDN